MKRIIVVGDKTKLALEGIESDECPGSGLVYLYVNNIKFGYEFHFYDIEAAVRDVIQYYTVEDFGTQKLIECPALVLFSAFDTCFNEEIDTSELNTVSIKNLNDDKVNDYYPDFYKNFLTRHDLDNCYFRLGNYIFDGVSLILIPKGERLRLYVRNNANDIFTDIVTTRIGFLELWKDFLKLWIKK